MNCPAGKCECVHYQIRVVNHCGISPTSDLGKFERCPWDSKIETPKKDHADECVEEILESTVLGIVNAGWDKTLLPIIKRHLVKSKGDLGRAWMHFINNSGPRPSKSIFISSLKAGGFIE